MWEIMTYIEYYIFLFFILIFVCVVIFAWLFLYWLMARCFASNRSIRTVYWARFTVSCFLITWKSSKTRREDGKLRNLSKGEYTSIHELTSALLPEKCFTLSSEVTFQTLGRVHMVCITTLLQTWFIISCRHWNPIWEKLFDSLLNTLSCAEQPSLRGFREEFERMYLEDEENYSRHRQRHEVFMF